jgi:hypothetical protein
MVACPQPTTFRVIDRVIGKAQTKISVHANDLYKAWRTLSPPENTVKSMHCMGFWRTAAVRVIGP